MRGEKLVIDMPFESFEVSLFGVLAGNRQIIFSIEFQFLLDNPEWFPGHLTLDRPVQYIIGDFRNIVWQFTCWDDFFNLREWCLIVGPTESLLDGLISSE